MATYSTKATISAFFSGQQRSIPSIKHITLIEIWHNKALSINISLFGFPSNGSKSDMITDNDLCLPSKTGLNNTPHIITIVCLICVMLKIHEWFGFYITRSQIFIINCPFFFFFIYYKFCPLASWQQFQPSVG